MQAKEAQQHPRTVFFRPAPAVLPPASEDAAHKLEEQLLHKSSQIQRKWAQQAAADVAAIKAYHPYPALARTDQLPPPPGWSPEWQATAALRGSCMIATSAPDNIAALTKQLRSCCRTQSTSASPPNAYRCSSHYTTRVQGSVFAKCSSSLCSKACCK